MHDGDDTADATNRRTLLLALGAAGVTGLAGCGSDDGDDTPTGTESPDGNDDTPTTTAGRNGDGDTPTDTETGTPTDGPTETLNQDLGDSPAEILSLDAGAAAPNSTVTVEGGLLNAYLFDLQAIELSVTAPEGWTVSPSDPVTIDSLPPGGSQEVSWDVSIPSGAAGQGTVTIDVYYESETDTAEVTVEESIRVFGDDLPTDGLVARYSFEGDTAADAVGDNDATINGHPEPGAPGVVGSAYDFDGADDFLTYPDLGVTYDGSADWATSLWINPDTAPSGQEFFLWHPRAKNDIFIEVYPENDEIRYTHWTGEPNPLSSGVTVTPEEWTHICVVSDTSADEQYRVFIDGALEATGDLPEPNSTSNSNLVAGQFTGPALDTRYFDGRMDELRLYDRALTAEEVQILTDQGT
jgi:hypothetical protein